MTQKNTTQTAEDYPFREWHKIRAEMAREVWENILDPIMTFAELARGYSYRNEVDLDPKEISAVLRLLVLGGYTETKLQASCGGNMTHVSGDLLEKEIKDWDSVKGGAA